MKSKCSYDITWLILFFNWYLLDVLVRQKNINQYPYTCFMVFRLVFDKKKKILTKSILNI